jgi:hypothetical protein
MNWFRIEKFYDLTKGSSDAITAIELTHRLIHSFIFMERENDKGAIDGLYFASDRTRRQALWFVSVDEFTTLLKECGTDYPSTWTGLRRPDSGQWISWRGNGEPPTEWTKKIKQLRREPGK